MASTPPFFQDADVRLVSDDFVLSAVGNAPVFTTESDRIFYPMTLDLVIVGASGSPSGVCSISFGTNSPTWTNLLPVTALGAVNSLGLDEWVPLINRPVSGTTVPSFAGGTTFGARVTIASTGTLLGRFILRGVYKD